MDYQTIYVWPDGTWYAVEDIDDLDIFLMESGKSDDFEILTCSPDFDPEQIDQWVHDKQKCERGFDLD